MKPRTFCLSFYLAPGDVTVMTALVRDLKRTHPAHTVFVDTSHPALWRHNPHARLAAGVAQAYPDVEHVRLDYGQGIHGPGGQKYRTIHFLRYLYEDFYGKTGVNLRTVLPHGDFHFGADERDRLVAGRYWVVAPGGKTDFPAKVWDAARFQRVVDNLRALGLGVVQVGAPARGGDVVCVNPRLEGVLDLVGRTGLRDLLRLIRDADGVVCGVSAPMHMAAALARPCVVVAGGREAWYWEAYVRANRGFAGGEAQLAMPQRYLHTIGLLDCVPHHGGCWKRALDPAGKTPCRKITRGESGPVATCMDMITVDHVMDAVMSYYRDDSLPPVGPVPAYRAPDDGAAPAPPPVLIGATEGIDGVRALPAAPPPAALPAPPPDDAVFDDPTIGGAFTVCVLLYGDYEEMHRRCLDGLLATLPAGRATVRLGSNQLGARSDAYVAGLVHDGRVAHWDRSDENRKKYPVMRRLFHDPALPLATNYVVWLDDDTICDRRADWLATLARVIVAEHPRGARLFGPRYIFTMDEAQQAWMKEASWYRGRPFQDQSGATATDGTKVHFATGSFWALATEVVRSQDIPDARLNHNGGDWCIGEQVWQAGHRLQDFSNNKTIVNWSATPRRGYREPPLGLK